MKAELIKSLDQRNEPAVAWQIEQVRLEKADYLLIYTPHEDAVAIVTALGLKVEQVIDLASQAILAAEATGKGQFLFDYPVPNQGRIEAGPNGTIRFESAGFEIAQVILYSDSPYSIQSITWLTTGGQASRKTIYQRNGRLFAQQYYSQGRLLQSDFYFGHHEPFLSNFYQNGQNDLTVVKDQKYPHYDAVVSAYLEKHFAGTLVETTDDSLLNLSPAVTHRTS